MYPASSEGLNKETDKSIYFFTPSFHPLDNFSAHIVIVWGIAFPTAEHAYQWRKFSELHADIAGEILSAPSPHIVKLIADSHKEKLPDSWHDEKVSIMEEVLEAKASQHEDVRDALKRSGTKRIIENSPVDNFWGIGPDGDGRNMVGEIWMKIRSSLIE